MSRHEEKKDKCWNSEEAINREAEQWIRAYETNIFSVFRKLPGDGKGILVRKDYENTAKHLLLNYEPRKVIWMAVYIANSFYCFLSIKVADYI